ncbi:MAG: YobA family protein [Thermoanaerobaculia bacterium]|nr:YobA family protein [Thermoanaerobaculia bacterium]
MRYLRVVLMASLALALAVSCGSVGDPSDHTPTEDPSSLPQRDFDIQGTITKVDPGSGGALVRILVEEQPGDRSGTLKDVVTVTAETRIYREKGEQLLNAGAGELRKGTVVAAWYEGAVMESYPRQATAVAIVIAE